MAMVVKNNLSAVRTLNTLNKNSSALQSSLAKVSSGMKINSAQDDAAGYAISERMRVRIRSLDQANQNTQNDSSLMKTAEGAVSNTVELLRALKEKAINAANDSNTDEDRQTIQKELNQFIDQIDDNALVQFNGKYLVDGSKNNAIYETKTVLLNQSLSTETGTDTALTALKNRAGDSLEILSTDKYQVSWVENGTIHTASGVVGSGTTLNDILSISDANGNKINGVATDAPGGLIGDPTPADPMADYKTANTAFNSGDTAADYTALQAIFTDDPDVQALTVDGTVTLSTKYYIKDANGEPTEATVTINYDAGATDKYTITVDGVDDGTEVQLYTAKNTTDEKIDAFTAGTVPDTAANVEAYLGIASGSISLGNGGTVSLKDLGFVDDAGNSIKLYVGDDEYDSADVGVARDGTTTDYYLVKDINEASVLGTSNKFTTGDVFTKDNPDYAGGNKTPQLTDKSGKAVYTPDKTQGIAFVANTAGVQNQVSGLTINILDQDNNVKKAANAALDQFKQYQRAENKTGDQALNFHIGSEANVAIKVGLGDMRAEALGLKGSNGERISVTTKENANAAINAIENALTKALDQQTTIGAIEARLEYTATNLTTSSENVQAAESTIRDADMAKEMTAYTKNNVLLQAAQAMLAQANQSSSAVLSLLQ